ncbi:MAG: hypothetical protein AAB416_03385 [Patescibacteria group bacterium]
MHDASVVARRLAGHIYRSPDVSLAQEWGDRNYGPRRLRNAGIAHARRMEVQQWLAEYGGVVLIVIFAAAMILPKLPL